MKLDAWLFIVLTFFIYNVCAIEFIPLPDNLPIKKDTVTVSGVSSGGAMAIQTHIAFSSYISGAAIYASPPYYCAMGNVEVAIDHCMKNPHNINVLELYLITLNTANAGFIDGVHNLQKDNVWLYSGLNDTIVHQEAVVKTKEYYEKLLFHPSQIEAVFNHAGEHAWTTNKNSLNDCAFLGSPYINNCRHNYVGDFLQHVLMKPNNITYRNQTTQIKESLFKFKQDEYAPMSPPQRLGIHEEGYIYIPKQCQGVDKVKHCHLHIAFHGCLQNSEVIDQQFFTDTGLNEHAEANDLVILYPQAHTTDVNPRGCWDWWGYSGQQYASNVGFQLRTILKLMERLLYNSV